MFEKEVGIYLGWESEINHLADIIGIKEIKSYYIPRQQYLIRNFDGNIKSKDLEASNMMEQFACSLQNSGRMTNSIKYNTNGEDIAKILFNFNPKKITEKYHKNSNAIYNKFEEALRLNKEKSNSNWKKYSQGLLDAAYFLCDEKNVSNINNAITSGYDDYKKDVVQNNDIILEIKQNVKGMGDALTRDFLKECGCLWLSKSDTHIIKVIHNLSDSKETIHNDGDIVKFIFEFAKHIREKKKDRTVTPYKIDKMIWLLCTGNFYNEENINGYRDIVIKIANNALLT